MRRFIRISSLVGILAGFAAGANAATIAYDVAVQTGNQLWIYPLGLDFNVNSPIAILELGVFDSGADGLQMPLIASIYDRATELRVATLSFPVGNTGTLVNGSRFLPLPVPLTLPAGFQGSIVAEGYWGFEPNGNAGIPGGFVPSTMNDGGGAISFVGRGRYATTSGVYPTFIDEGPANRYGAGTFSFEPIAVPEPTTLWLLGSGLYLMAAHRRRMSKRSQAFPGKPAARQLLHQSENGSRSGAQAGL